MYDFSRVSSKKIITVQDIYANQQMIFEYYFGKSIELKKRYTNPLRPGDKHPGCFFKWKTQLNFYDYSQGEQGVYNVFSYVMALFTCSFDEAHAQINRDFAEGLLFTKQIHTPFVKPTTKEKHKIQFLARSFTQTDLNWWGQYLITESELKKANVYSVEKLFIDSYQTTIPDVCYAYYYPEIDCVKIYKPLERKEFKWYSNVPYDYIDTLAELPKQADSVIIAKSKKDKLVLQKVFSEVCSTQGENFHAIALHYDEFFDSHYTQKLCFFDADETGKKANIALNSRGYGWINTDNFLYNCCGIKDPSDYVKEFQELTYIENLLRKKNIIK